MQLRNAAVCMPSRPLEGWLWLFALPAAVVWCALFAGCASDDTGKPRLREPSDAGTWPGDAPTGGGVIELGGSCDNDQSCRSGSCVDGVCCADACSHPCATCGSTGQCDRMPAADEVCQAAACPPATPCLDYAPTSTCAELGRCAACEPVTARRGAPCAAGRECDGQGACTLLANGEPCAAPNQCSSGDCVEGTCARRVRTCADLANDAREFVHAPELLEDSWPPATAVGGGVLLAGSWTNATQLCFDDDPVPTPFLDEYNAMFVVPEHASVGSHTLTVIGASGVVGQLPFRVLPELERPPVHPGTDLPILGVPPDLVVPSPVKHIPPITNSWQDEYIRGEWSMGGNECVAGTASEVELSGGTTRYLVEGGSVKVSFRARYDRLRRRMYAEVTNGCDDVSCARFTRSYVGVLACPANNIVTVRDRSRMVDLCSGPLADVCAVSDGEAAVIFVLFPDVDGARQAVLRKDGSILR